MAIVIDGKIYRNLQEQVQKNKDDIEKLQSDETDIQTALNGKQDKLTAGDNITIIDNVISSTGGDVDAEAEAREEADNALSDRIDRVNTNIAAESKSRADADTIINFKINSLDSGLKSEISRAMTAETLNAQNIETKQDKLTVGDPIEIDGDKYTLQIVNNTISLVKYEDPLCFESDTQFTLAISLDNADTTLEYSLDGEEWSSYTSKDTLTSTNNKIYLRGTGGTHMCTSANGQTYDNLVWTFNNATNLKVSGSVDSLLDYRKTPMLANNAYNSLFIGLPIITAPKLPNLTLATSCYMFMFQNCTSLTQAPKLPAINMASECYYYMFYGCSSLTQAPELPSINMASYCYYNMFNGCTSLTQAPELPATSLYAFCYSKMFMNCTSIKISETQTDEYKTAFTIPSSGTGSSIYSDWNQDMFTGTGGTFTGDPSINTTYYGAWE